MKVEYKVHFRRSRRNHKQIRLGPAPQRAPGRTPRISQLMALAIRTEQLVREGHLTSYAHFANIGYVTRARATQVMNLLRLAPCIIDELLHLPLIAMGRDAINERKLRPVIAQLDWQKQIILWNELKSRIHFQAAEAALIVSPHR